MSPWRSPQTPCPKGNPLSFQRMGGSFCLPSFNEWPFSYKWSTAQPSCTLSGPLATPLAHRGPLLPFCLPCHQPCLSPAIPLTCFPPPGSPALTQRLRIADSPAWCPRPPRSGDLTQTRAGLLWPRLTLPSSNPLTCSRSVPFI